MVAMMKLNQRLNVTVKNRLVRQIMLRALRVFVAHLITSTTRKR